MGETSIVNEVVAEKWVYGGSSLARADSRVVFVPFTLPGERVRVRTQEGNAKNEAALEEILEASPERVTPPCPVFARCGGCNYQHAPYSFELTAKSEILREQLRRIGKIEYTGEIESLSGPDYGYRNRVQLHLRDGKLGYLAAGSHDLVPITHCPIASPRINEAITMLRERMGAPKFPHFVKEMELFSNETDIQINVLETERPVAQWFYKSVGSVVALDYPTAFGTFRVSPRSFFQVNRFLLNDLIRIALPQDGGGSALDLYSGVGLFAIPLASRFENVDAVESGVTATRDLELNAQTAGVKVSVHRDRVEDYLARLKQSPDFVLADPPRAGLGKAVVGHLARLAPKRITIVSCDPATLARDLAGLSQYQIERVIVADLFPRTYHLETVVHLRLG